MSGHKTAHRSHCSNCGSPLTGAYCAKCGQHDVDYHRSIGPIMEDALEGFIHFDGKFFKSVRYIFARPGFLTKEFIAGRRTRYTHPVRFYIFASFLYFAVHLMTSHPPASSEAAAAPQGAEAASAAKDTGGNAAAPATSKPLVSSTAFRRDFGLDGKLDRRALATEIGHLMPSMFFFCLPLLAAVLMLAYRTSGRYYIEHLIFAFHVQAFGFLAALIDEIGEALLRLAGVGDPSLLGFLTFCGAALLIYRAFRVVYGQGRFKTLLKMAMVGGAYGLFLLIGVVLVALASAFIVSRGA
jgi:Protein of unknown function (DUF3667)